MGAELRITSTGNAGVHVETSEGSVFIDAFWEIAPRFPGGHPAARKSDGGADLILVTHAHWDHFSAERVAEAARRTGATVGGPKDVIAQLRGTLPQEQLAALEPPENVPGRPASSVVLDVGHGSVTAYRTFHGQRHNSYLVQLGGVRFFHDGDNEDTRPLEVGALAPVDALLLCPWQGSDWVRFVEQLAPRKWLLIHLTDEEIGEQRAGRFLPALAERVPLPERVVALRPGESVSIA